MDDDQLKSLIAENWSLKRNILLQKLTTRELSIMNLVAQGLTSKEIAAKEKIGFETVKTHRKKIFKKLGVKNIAELIQCINEYDLLC